MVTLEQIEQLDDKVKKVVERVKMLQKENHQLFVDNQNFATENQRLQKRIEEMERQMSTVSGTHDFLSKGIVDAINQLAALEEDSQNIVEDEKSTVDPVIVRHEEPVTTDHSASAEVVDALLVADVEQNSDEEESNTLDIF